MKPQTTALALAISVGYAAMSSSIATASSKEGAAPKEMEKCYGIAKAAMNDCGTPLHNCAGHATKDGDSTDWLYLPKGSCDKIAGGKTR